MLIDFAFLVHGHQIADSEGFEFPRETTPEKLNFQLIVWQVSHFLRELRLENLNHPKPIHRVKPAKLRALLELNYNKGG